MLKSDAQRQKQSANTLSDNLDSLDVDTISVIQKDIDPYDMVSLVFLLYEVPETALERLVIYQRIAKDIKNNNTNLLYDWALHVRQRTTWKDEFLEALVTCQLFSIIRKLGLNVRAIKRKYQCTDAHKALINPLKKTLYKLCENINADNLYKLKKTLVTYDIDVVDYECCELILLDLMCRRFITIQEASKDTKNNSGIKNIAKILDNFPELVTIASDLRQIEISGADTTPLNSPGITSTPSLPVRDRLKKANDKHYPQEFNEVFEMFNELNVTEDEPVKKFKSDTMLINKAVYRIINPKNVGVCLIINQEKFHPSKDSIEAKIKVKPLDDRIGSSKDKEVLRETMTNLHFEVITRDNLDHGAMIENIKDVIKYRVREEHSMFMLCILSHGTRGHVYAADSTKVKVEDIESILDSDIAFQLRDKPKLLILQACQVEDDEPCIQMVADSPRVPYKYYIKKSDVIIYWATAPNYEAYRHEKMGSIFIQILCKTIQHCSKKEHVNDIFTLVNYSVKKICVRLQREQLPKVEHTLMKNLYLQIPEK